MRQNRLGGGLGTDGQGGGGGLKSLLLLDSSGDVNIKQCLMYQNLHWKLGQKAPSFGSILAYLETTA